MLREKTVKREIRVLNVLLFINTTVWKYLFGKPADSLEKSTENKDEYMLTDNDPLVSRFISVPKDMASFSPCSFIAGVVEAIMDSCQCVSFFTLPSSTAFNSTALEFFFILIFLNNFLFFPLCLI
ncbi:Transport protein particle subunit trs31 [Smittium culicis]|uniref:Transport protein particle subunit trs31 n=1 Tax=Smittium culicis TaxID=133412 RepID=A0A1R1XPB0_9FUNG|nr:Transport protein particle subunit trs31 [Smittium culicis]